MGPVKAALESVTRYVTAELGPKGISVHALPKLLPEEPQRSEVIELVEYVVGGYEDMAPKTKAMLQNIRSSLELPFPSQLRTAAA